MENELVQQRLREYRVLAREPVSEIEPRLLARGDSLGEAEYPIRWAMSFDGSAQEVAAREEYPSTRVGFVQIAGVLVYLDQLLGQEQTTFVDPQVIHASSHEALHSIVLPGSNVCRPEMPTVKASWRAEVYDIFRQYRVEDTPLFDVFWRLLEHSDKLEPDGPPRLTVARCPGGCGTSNIAVSPEGVSCPSCRARVFPTDVLRMHEEVSEEHANVTALGRLMTVLEHITMVAYVDFLLRRQPRLLGYVAFLLDGPLALFGPQAWLHTAILSFVHAACENLTEQNLRQPIILGIEKTGQFAEHAAAIEHLIPPGCLMQLPDDYIYRHIVTFRDSPQSSFGRDTYYGQKFYYRTARGQLLTITVPKPKHPVAESHAPANYEMLPRGIALLERIGTGLYQNALIPVALAHSFASIPLRTGSKVLTLLTKELLSNSP